MKYVTKARILVDTWTRDRELGTVPLEIHNLSFLRARYAAAIAVTRQFVCRIHARDFAFTDILPGSSEDMLFHGRCFI